MFNKLFDCLSNTPRAVTDNNNNITNNNDNSNSNINSNNNSNDNFFKLHPYKSYTINLTQSFNFNLGS